jgi:hypothetical protein
MTPVEVLQEQLDKFEKNIKKSEESLAKGDITPELHRIHRTNNEPKIKEFKYAIRILRDNTE